MSAVAAGYLADRLLGDPQRFHPVAGFGKAAARVEHFLWRDSRAAGVLHTAVCVGAAVAVTRGVHRLSGRSAAPFGTFVAWTAIGGRSLGRIASSLADAVERGDIDEARAILPSLAGRDPSALDGPELCRAALESVAENTADAVVGPLLWGAVAGPSGVALYRAANTLDAMVGHKTDRYLRFGWASARLDDVLNWPVARLGALLTAGVAPLRGADARLAFRALRRDGAKHPSPNAGRMEAAFAGALGVTLGGTNVYRSGVEARPHLGDGPVPAPADVRRGVRLGEAVGAAAAVLCALVTWARARAL